MQLITPARRIDIILRHKARRLGLSCSCPMTKTEAGFIFHVRRYRFSNNWSKSYTEAQAEEMLDNELAKLPKPIKPKPKSNNDLVSLLTYLATLTSAVEIAELPQHWRETKKRVGYLMTRGKQLGLIVGTKRPGITTRHLYSITDRGRDWLSKKRESNES